MYRYRRRKVSRFRSFGAIVAILVAIALVAVIFSDPGSQGETAPLWMDHGQRALYNQNQQTQQKLDEANRLEEESLRLERERLELEKERLRMQQGYDALLD